ncbi:alanine racemase [Azospirillum fermentarium]|nr:alanine racemase [Azospirillum fermentarium]MCW2246340.1 alanine racemase [Azospirillum fermentarium]
MSAPADRAGAILTIDLGAVVENWRRLSARLSPAPCAAVVKADGYGLGAAAVGRALFGAGCTRFFVAQLDEALALRAALPDPQILCLGGLPARTDSTFVHHRITPVLNHLGEVDAWAAVCRERNTALPAAIHIDTGMNRLGLSPAEVDELSADPTRLTGIGLDLWMSHLACADEAESPVSGEQLARMTAAVARLPKAPVSFANSSGIFLGSAYHFDLGRPGVALYGVNPTPGKPNPMVPTIRLDARVLQVRSVDLGMTVGYGAAHRMPRAGRIATLGVGYADGYFRSLGARGHVFVDGVPAPVVGRISMDLITVDVSGLADGAVVPGKLVELIGPNRPVDTVAEEAGTIGYEILTSLGRRYHRDYTGGDAGKKAV